MTVDIFVYIGILFLSAFVAKAGASKIGVPEVTGYVIVGVALGISLIGLLNEELLELLEPLSSVALGIIAFIIGSELRWSALKKLGPAIPVIVLFEGLGAFGLVGLSMFYLLQLSLELSLLLAAVAAATAPAATVAVIRQYRASGPLTSTILAVVGIDDAMALMIYVFVSSFVKSSLIGGHASIGAITLTALLEIGGAVVIGVAVGFLFSWILRHSRSNEWVELLLAGTLTLLLGVSHQFGLSELLMIMAFAATVANVSPGLNRRSATVVEWFSPVFLAAFFVLGGAHLDVSLFLQVGLVGLGFFLARSLGKIGGASLGAFIGRAPKRTRRLIGLALLPQVGVALALALSVAKEFDNTTFGVRGHQLATVVINVLLFTTILTEIIGPLLTRIALKRAGELKG